MNLADIFSGMIRPEQSPEKSEIALTFNSLIPQ
jgi:hypothetical protein